MLIEGVFAAITTPFYPDERVYYRKIEANVARYSRSQLAGMVVLGSTGEAPALETPDPTAPRVTSPPSARPVPRIAPPAASAPAESDDSPAAGDTSE